MRKESKLWKIRQWRWLDSSPARINESNKLELPGAWEPPSNSKPLPVGEGKETQHLVLNGNKMYKRKDGSVTCQNGV
jgi:hypothetical protein